jgi:hypothetical protein
MVTLVDFRIQKFLNSIYESLPEVANTPCEVEEETPDPTFVNIEPFANFNTTYKCGTTKGILDNDVLKDAVKTLMEEVKSLYTFGEYETVNDAYNVTTDLAM